jgi:hypothetical protein
VGGEGGGLQVKRSQNMEGFGAKVVSDGGYK